MCSVDVVEMDQGLHRMYWADMEAPFYYAQFIHLFPLLFRGLFFRIYPLGIVREQMPRNLESK